MEIAGATPPLAPELAEGSRWWLKLRDIGQIASGLCAFNRAAGDHGPTIDALLRILSSGRSQVGFDDIVESLRNNERWADLVKLLSEQAAMGSTARERIKAQLSLAEIYGGPLQNEERAFETLSDAFSEDPSHPVVLARLVELGRDGSRIAELVSILSAPLQDDSAGTATRRVAVALAETFEGLGKPLDALMVCKRYQVPASNGTMLRLLRSLSRHEELARALEKALQEPRNSHFKAHRLELASLYADHLQMGESAVALYRQILERDPHVARRRTGCSIRRR